jgi:hypothetical protein
MTKKDFLIYEIDQEGLTKDAELTKCAERAVLKAMDQYAKQQCMIFAEWLAINECHYYRDDNEWGVAMQFPYKTYSTEELYDLKYKVV